MTAFVFKYRHYCCVIGGGREGKLKKRDIKKRKQIMKEKDI